MKNILNPLAKSILISLQLTTVAPVTDAAIPTKVLRSGKKTSKLSNKEMNDIIIIVTSLNESTSLTKGTSDTIKNKAKEQKEEFLSMLGTLCANLLGNLISSKSAVRVGESTTRAGHYF